jgi:hypothetical protein
MNSSSDEIQILNAERFRELELQKKAAREEFLNPPAVEAQALLDKQIDLNLWKPDFGDGLMANSFSIIDD